MPLEPKDLRHLTAAHGYLDLGMFPDTEAELDLINPDVRHLPEVLSVRLEIYLRQENWERVLGIAARLIQNDPQEPQWSISYAYATRRAQTLEEAKAILLEAIGRHPREPMIPYNLACYECQLGNLESAKLYLEQAIKMNPGFRAGALEDPDLEPLWDSPGAETA
jgi:tetratricopeptide (TPR) repeat protein